MLFSKSMKFAVLAATTLASLSFAKPIAKNSVDLSTRGHGTPKLYHRGLLNLPIGTPSSAPSPGTAPGVLVNLDTKLGSLMTGDLNGTVPGNDGSVVGVTTDIENLKNLIENVQSLLANTTTSLSGATGGGPISLEDSGAITNIVKVSALLGRLLA
ncbi:hypothetical protein NMY22_g16146 [Coprinellus aureogranulatus]|nr:hypothetical protein NMY22_g16146 [Coprinellus aureogranulatus]